MFTECPVTIQKYRRDVSAFAAFAGSREVTKKLVIHYKQWLIDRYAPASVNSMLAAVNRFFKDMGWYDCVVKSVSKVFLHNLRHLFACLYYKASKDLSHLADLLGHSSINTTRIYTSMNGETHP